MFRQVALTLSVPKIRFVGFGTKGWQGFTMRAHSTPSFASLAVASAVAALCVSAAGCSSSQNPGGACNPCAPTTSDDAGTDAGADDLNPDGIAYPTPPGGYGRSARTGKTPGSVMQNFKFQGYPEAVETKGLQTIALSEYYDPCGKRLKMLHLTVAGVWCVPCNDETDALVAAKADLASKGVVVIQALSDGPTEGVGATLGDLNNWIAKHMSNFTEMLDPGLTNPDLGGFFQASAIPWNCDLDPRTMEIIDESTGWAGDVDTELEPGLTSLPVVPGYPIPAVCGDQ
jgi:hypothetical protein